MTQESKAKEFTINDVGYVVRPLTSGVQKEAKAIYVQALHEALENGYPLKAQNQRILDQKGMLDLSVEEKRAEKIGKEIRALEIELRSARRPDGTRLSKEEGREIAMRMRKLRTEARTIGEGIANFLNDTAEGVAENEQLQYLLYASTYNVQTGKRAWASYEAFKEDSADANTDSTNNLYTEATKAFISVLNGVDQDFRKQNYEIKWLIRMGFMNEDLRLLDSQGRLVDEEGRLTDKDGRYVNEDGQYIDAYGNLVDEEGNLLVEDGWGVEEEEEVATS